MSAFQYRKNIVAGPLALFAFVLCLTLAPQLTFASPAAPALLAGIDASGNNSNGSATDSFFNEFVSGNYEYVVAGGSAVPCSGSAGSAIGCELQVYDISTPSAPVYVGGADASGLTNSGTGSLNFNGIYISGHYAYITASSNATACSQTAGSAIGCELQVYDISTPSAPTYVGGADASGSANSGTGSSSFFGIFIVGNDAYIATNPNSTACSQSAGSAIGCEFQVYDISTPSAPAYIGGADASGSTNSGTGSGSGFKGVYVSGNFAYIASAQNSGTCSQTAGSAIGCELQVYNISTPSAPTYVGGADASGSTNSGTGSAAFNSISVSGNFAYIAGAANATTCSQTAGSAIGCELKVFNISTPATPTYAGGADVSGSTNSGTGNASFNTIFVSGSDAYVGTQGSNGSACSQTAGSATNCELQVYDIATPATPTYVGGADSSGSTNSGSGGASILSIFVSGNYAYVGYNGNSINCASTDKSGCELQIFDISTPTTPTYVGGQDASGNLTNGSASLGLNKVFVLGNYAYVGTQGNTAPCSQTNALGCELQVYDISNPASPTYVGGADSSGSTNSGTTAQNVQGIYVSGNYVYLAMTFSATACSQSAGSAIGCELQVYDVSTPSAPTYVGGADASGSTNSGTANGVGFTGVYVSGNYAYVVDQSNATACSQTAGNAIGCELKVFDVSTPATPTYVGGADASGSTNSGTGSLSFNRVYVSGNDAYVTSGASATTCSQTAGSAIGCELKVFDISTPATPTYVGGADASGSTNSGTGSSSFGNLSVSGNYAYIPSGANATACSQTAGNAIGCELQIYDISTPATPTYVGGADASGSTNSGTDSLSFSNVLVSGNYAYVTTGGSATTCSQTAGSATGCELQDYDVSTPSTPTYVGGADSSGSTNSGIASVGVAYEAVSGNSVFLTKFGNATNCALTDKTGCEFLTFNIGSATAPTVTTQTSTSITSITATGNGNITATGGSNATVRGFAYGIDPTLSSGVSTTTESGSFSTGAFTAVLSGLTCNTTYYTRAYATNTTGTGYGAISSSFMTFPCSPSVTTQSASSITQTTATANGTITATGGATATVRGFAWGTNSALSGGDTATTTDTADQPFSTGAFTAPFNSLTCNTAYYTRAYATNTAGDGLGSIITFTTSACPVAPTPTPTGGGNGPVAGGGGGGGPAPVALPNNGSTATTNTNTTTTTSSNPVIAALQTQLQNLLAQIAVLTGTAPTTPSAQTTSAISITHDLQLNSTGGDVQTLQIWLNAHGFTVSTSGAGSAGNETTTFGSLTKAALAKFQASVGITPASGYFGPITRAYIAAHQ